MGDDDDILAALEFHDDRLETDDHVTVGLTAAITIVVLVVVAGFKVLGVALGDFLIGQAVAHARVKLVEGLPLEFGVAHLSDQVAGGLDGAL